MICNLSMVFAQSGYTGTIDTYPIEVTFYLDDSATAKAVYCYSKSHIPILISGALTNNGLTLYETDNTGKKTASLVFSNFSAKPAGINGVWTNLATNKQLGISLNKIFSVDDYVGNDMPDQELLQVADLKAKYLKLVIHKAKGDSEPTCHGIKQIDKKTNETIQFIPLDCSYYSFMGPNSIETGDYNFDGTQDLSILEMTTAGPNTLSLYYLCDPVTGMFPKIGEESSTLEFDAKNKKVTSYNRGSATAYYKSTYKWVSGKLKLIETHRVKPN